MFKYIDDVSSEDLASFRSQRLFVPGRLFGMLYSNPQDYHTSGKISASVYYDGDKPVGVCIYIDNFKFGWSGDCSGIVGAYVKPDYRKKGIAKKLAEIMMENNDRSMGYTYDLAPVVKNVNNGNWSQLYG